MRAAAGSPRRRRLPDATLRLERALFRDGAGLVGGMDEVGRGAWAGPVVVGVAVIDAATRPAPKGTRDSKLLAEARRESLAPQLARWCPMHGIGSASASEIDDLGLTAALALAACRALETLERLPDVLILDGPYDFVSASWACRVRALPSFRVRTLVDADRKAGSVAAASVLAKTARDAEMRALGTRLPGYGFEQHKGYGTRAHHDAVASLGLTEHHRRSWQVDGPSEDDAPRLLPDLVDK